MECIVGGATVGGRFGQRIDHLEQLDHRSRPAVRDDQRHRVRVTRLDVDEVDVHAVDLRHELRKGVQLRLRLSPVVVRRPVADELLERRELHALRPIVDELLGGPAGRREAPLEVGEVSIRHVDAERPDCGVVVFGSGRR